MSDHSARPLAGSRQPVPLAKDDPHGEAKRLQRLADGVRRLRSGGGALKLNERILMILGGIIAPLGLVLVFLGWQGASHTPNLFEQIPYLISGGLFGLGLVFLGAFFYFTHWLTELVKEHRAQSTAVIDAITRLETAITTSLGATAGTRSSGMAIPAPAAGPPAARVLEELVLVATERGSMAHRLDCVVVAGKNGLRSVRAADGLAACKLCGPYVVAAD